MSNSVYEAKYQNTVIFTLRGPLNKTLKNKLKNKSSKILNDLNTHRNLSKLYLTLNDASETKEILESARTVKYDLKGPAVQIALLHNKINTNIITNSHSGTYITLKNKNTYFNNIGNPITFSGKSGYFLKKGSGAKLLKYVINKQKEQGVKTIFVHPENKELEKYYEEFGFIPLQKVPKNINRPKIVYESLGYGHLMYLEL